MSYYANRTQADANQSALGRLNLANCSVRRPTTDHGKGKFGARCMRLDLDLEEQQAFQMAHGMSGLAASFHLDGVVPGLSSSMSKGDVDKDDSEAKGKYLLAAESLQSVEEWMAAMDFWSRKKGNHIRRSLIAAHIMQDMESQKTNETFDDDFDDDDDDEAAGSCASSSTKLNSVSVSSEGDNLPSELVELSRHWSAVAVATCQVVLRASCDEGQSHRRTSSSMPGFRRRQAGPRASSAPVDLRRLGRGSARNFNAATAPIRRIALRPSQQIAARHRVKDHSL